jgi:subtilase family serine protease
MVVTRRLRIFAILAVVCGISQTLKAQVRYADSVIAFSTQYTSTNWSAKQILGPPNTYPKYGDMATAWAPETQDFYREWINLSFRNPAPVQSIAIYETYNPGAIDTVYVKNPSTGQWQVVWSGTAAALPNPDSRIFLINFPVTSFNVGEVRLAINSPAVIGWNEYDAVGISATPIALNLPDLSVTQVQAPYEAWTNQTVDVTWLVGNYGSVATGSTGWVDRVYLSPNPALDLKSTSASVDRANPTALNRGQSYAGTASVTIPHGLKGNYYFYVSTDVNRSVPESLETNNITRSAMPILLHLSPAPDLMVTSLSAPTIAFAGDTVFSTYSVKNIGKAVAAAAPDTWIDQFFLSKDTVLIANNATRVTAINRTVSLQPDSSYRITVSYVVPKTFSDTYYLYIYTDARDVIYENLIESNNVMRSQPMQIVSVPPDLKVLAMTAPGTGASGQKIQMEWTVANNGVGATIATSWTDRIYSSTSSVFDSRTATVLGSFDHQGALAAGASYHAIQSLVLPNGMSGQFHLFAQADYSGAVFERSTAAQRILRSTQPIAVSLSPWPDLRVTSLQVPATGNAGKEISISWSVDNKGSGATPNRFWNDQIFVSADSAFGSAAVHVADVLRSAPLSPGERYSQTSTVTIPPSISGKAYVFVWCDGDNTVYEPLDKVNKRGRSSTVTIAPYPQIDLSVASVSLPDTASGGQMVDVQWVVKNVGGGRTLADTWDDVLYLSKSLVFRPDTSVKLAEFGHQGALDGGGSYSRSLQTIVPDGLSGQYYAVLLTDYLKHSGDTALANNARFSSKALTLKTAVRPDLAVTSIRTDDSVLAGQPTTIRWTVTNSLSVPVPGTWYDAVYLSASGVLDKAAMKLESHYHGNALGSQSSYTDSIVVTIPLSLAGSNRIVVQADVNNSVLETTKANNIASAASVLHLAAPSDLIVTSVAAPDSVEPGDMMTVTYTIRNQGINLAKGILTDAVYLSTDTTWSVTDPLLGIVYREINLTPDGAQKNSVRVRASAFHPDGTSGTSIGELPGIPPGPYHVIVRTDVRDNIPEVSDANNSYVSPSVLQVRVKKLTRNTPQQVSLRKEQSKYYSFTASAGEDILVSLDGGGGYGFNELFVSYADLPSRGKYDYLYLNQYSVTQQVTISSSKAGTYYLLIRGTNVPGDSSSCTILVKTLQFHVDSVESPIAGIGGEVTVLITGAAFKPGAYALLRRGGSPTVRDNSDLLLSSTKLIARFATAGMTSGNYDVVVVNPDGQEAVLQGGLALKPGDPSQILVAFAAPNRLRVNSVVPMNIVVTNPTNMNVQRALITLRVRKEMRFWVETDQSLFKSAPRVSSADSLIDEEGNRFFSVLLYNLAPRQTKMIRVLVEPTAVMRYIFIADSYVLDRAKFDSVIVLGVREGTNQRWLPPPGTLMGSGLGKQGSVAKTAEACPYDNEDGGGACAAWNNRERNIDISRDLPGVASAGAEATDITELDRESASKLYKFYKTLMNFFNKYKNSSGYAGDAVSSLDPNDLVGPPGYGDDHWVTATQTLPYTISFENDPVKANAPAQNVMISMKLDSTVDANSFRLGNFGFAGKTFTQAAGRTYHTQRLDCRDSLGLYVDFVAGVDVSQNSVFWSFKAIDPATGAPPADPMLGMLPVNDALHHGEGSVNYTINPKPGTKTRDIIAPKARIIFDSNEPLDTPPMFNTIDAGVPVSTIQALPAQGAPSPLLVSWSGLDDARGSGIRSYSVFVSKNDSAFTPWLTNVADTSARFTGAVGSKYKFFSLATDNAGNTESIKTKADANVVVTSLGPTEQLAPATYWLEQNYPNPFNPSTTIRYGLREQSNVRIDIYNVLGQRVMELNLGTKAAGAYNTTVDMSRFSSGIYVYRIDAVDGKGGRFVTVKKMMMIK